MISARFTYDGGHFSHRYGKRPEEWNAILKSNPAVRAYAVLIASNE
jgi:hypothetical protein